jgi:hypothetical protein
VSAPLAITVTLTVGEMLAVSEALTAHRGLLGAALKEREGTEARTAIRAVILDNQKAHSKLCAAFKGA